MEGSTSAINDHSADQETTPESSVGRIQAQSMEGSSSAINDHLADQELGAKSILNDFKTTPETLESQTPENLDCSSSNTKAGEPAESDVNATSSVVDKTPEPISVSSDHPCRREESSQQIERQTISQQWHNGLPSANHHDYSNLLPPEYGYGYGYEYGHHSNLQPECGLGSTFSGPCIPEYYPHLQPGFYAPQPGLYPSYTDHFVHQGQSSTNFGAHLAPSEQFDCDKPQNISDIIGLVVNFSFSKQGSWFIQQKLENCSEEDKMTVFNEVIPHIFNLSINSSGNFVISKLLERGNTEQRKMIAEILSREMRSLSFDKIGSHVIEKALEVIDLEQKLLLVRKLDGHVMEWVQHRYGNFVIRKCIECLAIEQTGFIISSFQGQVPQLAIDSTSCRVIQTALAHCLNESQFRWFVDEIIESACFLSQDDFGSYVIRDFIRWGNPDDRSEVIGKLAEEVVDMSRHKSASNVVKKCFEHGNTEDKDRLIGSILAKSNGQYNLLAMIEDNYAFNVVLKAFDTGNKSQREALTRHVKVNLPDPQNYMMPQRQAAFHHRFPI